MVKSLVIEVDDKLHQKLKEKAVKKQQSMKELVTPALEDLVK